MQAGLLPNPTMPEAGPTDLVSGMDVRITMLDGDLGAVVDPSTALLASDANSICWPPCVICGAGA